MEIKSFKEAKQIAKEVTESTGILHIGVDRSRHVSPRYNYIEAFKVGDLVSYAFNGDYYPDGVISKISKSLKVITTSSGGKFYRRRQSGSWIKDGTWSLIKGHIDVRNPSF